MAYYLVNSTIKGESIDSTYPNSVHLLSFDQGIVQPMSATQTFGGGTTARAEFDLIKVTKYVDKASPMIYQACASGQNLGEVLIYLVRSDGGGKTDITYLTVKLGDVVVASVHTLGSNARNNGAIPIETIGLRYTKISWTYTQQALSGGSSGSTKGAWNLARNMATF